MVKSHLVFAVCGYFFFYFVGAQYILREKTSCLLYELQIFFLVRCLSFEFMMFIEP